MIQGSALKCTCVQTHSEKNPHKSMFSFKHNFRMQVSNIEAVPLCVLLNEYVSNKGKLFSNNLFT